MTEADWLRCRNPSQMLRHLLGQLPYRQLLLIGCGCYRLAWDAIPLLELRSVIEEVEQAADGESTTDDNSREYDIANRARNLSTATQPGFPPAYKSVNGRAAAWAAYSLNAGAWMDHERYVHPEVVTALSHLEGVNRKPSVNRRGHAAIIRCIVGNPFRPVTFDPRWSSETAVALATGIYAERAFDRLPIVADALEEASCDHPDVLTHCRNPGIHARGCWVVDSILGKR